MSGQDYSYYAFISYNHNDAVWARRLQRRLEQYRLPTALCREQPDLPKRIAPVFLDASDLVASSSLLESLRRRLDDSRYLIVLCSPNSAASPWVNDEVEHFIETGRKDRIVPFIVDGEPHARDPARECYPPALRDLPGDQELLGISVAAHGQRGAFLRLVATILGLKLEQVASRDKAARRRRGIVYGSVALLALIALSAGIWYNVPHTAYYTDYTYRWEEPVGLGEVSRSQRAGMDYTYRFTTLRGDVTEVARVNSAGTLVRGAVVLNWEDPPRMRFYYGSSESFDGRAVTHVTCYDVYGREQYEKHYSADLTAVDFVQSGNSGASFSLGTDLLSSQANVGISNMIEDRGDAIRYIQTYDEDGYLVQRMFKRDNRGSSGGTPTQDSNGVWGIGYLRDEVGRIAGTRCLDRDGAPMAASDGVAGCDFTYDACGRIGGAATLGIRGEPTASSDSVAATALKYDALGRLIELSYFGLDGERTNRRSDGISVCRYEYDERGFQTAMAQYDAQMEPCRGTLGYFRCEGTVDERGRTVRVDFYDGGGDPVPYTDGYASVEYTLDEDGLILEQRYFDTEGRPAPDLTVNAYAVRCSYTDRMIVRIDYLDGEGRLMTSKRGYASICYEYNDQRELVREWYLDPEGDWTAAASSGVAEAVFTYTDGNRTGEDYYDASGARCSNSDGVASYVTAYETGSRTFLSCFGTEGEPVLCADGYHSWQAEYDEYGRLTRMSYYGVEGERVFCSSDDCSAVAYTYDGAGRVLTETYYDTEDREWQEPISGDRFGSYQESYTYDGRGDLTRIDYAHRVQGGMVAAVEYTRDERGNVTSILWLDGHGVPIANNNGDTRIEHDYDALDRKTESRWYTGTDPALYSREVYQYDELGRQTHITVYNGDGSVYGNIDSRYDVFGNGVEAAYSNRDGRPDMTMTGFARVENRYDVFGNMTDSRYYDDLGQPCAPWGDGVFHYAATYSVTGAMLTKEKYDIHGELLARETYAYDRCGRVTGSWTYDGSGACTGGIGYTYDVQGNEREKVYYDGDGTPMETTRYCFIIHEVFQGTAAEAAGLRAGDIFVAYNDWTFDLILDDPNECLTRFSRAIQDGADREKEIAIARYGEDGETLEFIRLTLPEGAAGYRVADQRASMDQVEEILGSYHRWLGE